MTQEGKRRAQEAALARARNIIQDAMDASGITKAQLARRLGVKPGYITRFLQGGSNLTIRTLARALASCGFEFNLKLIEKRKEKVKP